MNTLEIVLAVVIIFAALVQIVILFLLFRMISKFLMRTDRLMDTIEPEIKDVAAGVRSVRAAAEVSAREISALVTTVRVTTDELSDIVRAESHQISDLIDRTIMAADRQVEEVEEALDVARGRVADIGDRFDRTVLEPARILLAVGVGLRRGVEAVFGGAGGRRRSLDPEPNGRHS